jgi:type III polyketide synthase
MTFKQMVRLFLLSAPKTQLIITLGLIATITKDVPKTAVSAIQPMFDSLRTAPSKKNTWTHLQPTSFDWAIHPGGAAILKGAQQAIHLTDDHIRASLEVYHNNGNTSSATVLVVLDKLRGMGKGRDHIVATSFGPGLMIEMCVMKRCRGVEAVPLVHSGSGRKYKMCLPLPSRLVRMVKRMMTSRREKEGKQEIMSVAS